MHLKGRYNIGNIGKIAYARRYTGTFFEIKILIKTNTWKVPFGVLMENKFIFLVFILMWWKNSDERICINFTCLKQMTAILWTFDTLQEVYTTSVIILGLHGVVFGEPVYRRGKTAVFGLTVNFFWGTEKLLLSDSVPPYDQRAIQNYH